MTEAELQAAVIDLCDGQDPPLPWIHIGDSRRADAGGPWRRGFPALPGQRRRKEEVVNRGVTAWLRLDLARPCCQLSGAK